MAVEEKWDSHVLVINKVAPDNWKVGCVTYAFMIFLLVTMHRSDGTLKFGIPSPLNPQSHFAMSSDSLE